jgi:Ni,Fe-hydrogenase III small subunit/formate hydrogenlyase subunit 6/NADH:ubiquinone oxidoreductase subunit I
MLNALRARLQQGHQTLPYPKTLPELPGRFRGMPHIDKEKCSGSCADCAASCPTGAIAVTGAPAIDLGKCLFCTACSEACPAGAITFTRNHRLAARNRDDLVTNGALTEFAFTVSREIRKLFGRSLALRQVCAGGCNACEADINVLTTIGWDLGRFGIQIVASPRHADGLVVTGPVTENMRVALLKTYDAVPDPKVVIAVGACAINGGPFTRCDQHHGGLGDLIPVDLFIPGCPPHPLTILDGLLRFPGIR